jgi:dihydrolipoamide dehydrogenase
VDGRKVLDSRQALDLELPPESLAVIGAGAIGLEMATIYARLGCEVTVLELLPQILPGCDLSMSKRLERLLKKEGIKIHTKIQLTDVEADKDQVCLHGTCLKDGSEFEISAEKVLMAVGRRPNTSAISRLSLTENNGFVRTSAFLETDAPGLYAIGDLIGGKLLAHKASHEGQLAVENAYGERKALNPNALPAAVFTDPEYASVGLTEQEAREQHGDLITVGLFPLQASGRALTLGEQEGCVKVIGDAKDKILGAHILAPHASEMISEVVLAMEQGHKLQDVASAVHIHPTLSESVMEASLKALGRAIHILNL